MAEQPGLTFARRQQTGEHFHGGGLAATVGAEKAEDLTTVDAEAHVIHGREIPEPTGEIPRLDGHLLLASRARLHHHGTIAFALFGGQQGDERLFQGARACAREQVLRRAGGQHAPLIHGHQPIEACRFLHVGGGHQHAHAGPAGADAIDEFPELSAGQGIHTGGGLVEDQQVRVVDERAAQAQLLLHAARQFARGAMPERGQSGGMQQLVDTTLAFAAVMAEQPAEEIHVLEHRERGVKVLAQTLRHVGDARQQRPSQRWLANVCAEHVDAPGLDGARAGDEGKQARLAHTVRPDDADHDARRQVEADPVQGLHFAIAKPDAAQANHRRRRLVHAVVSVHCSRLVCRRSGHGTLGSVRT